MPRLPYKPLDLAEPKEVVDAIRARRGGALLELDRILLYSPPVAKGWNALLGAIRTQTLLPARDRELAMCAVAILNGADYEYVHHAPLLIAAGATQAQADALRTFEATMHDEAKFLATFGARDCAVLRLAHEMTRNVQVAQATFDGVRRLVGDDQQFFELIATIAAYNMVSRVLVATGIEPE